MGTTTDSYADSPPATVVLTFGQLWQIPTFLIGLVILGGVWAARPLWYDPEALRFGRNLAQSRRAVETGEAVQEATHLLVDALGHVGRHPQHQGEIQFLLGSAYVRLAEKASNDKSKELWQQASRYLEQAQQSGVPDADKGLLIFRSAQSRYFTDQSAESLKKIIVEMNGCVERLPEQRWEALGILTQAYLKANPPDVKSALLTNERQLQLPQEDDRLLDPVRLLRGELQIRTGEREEARGTLARISKAAPAALLQRARYLRAQSFQDEQIWSQAAELWEQIIADTNSPPTDTGHVLYCLGVCYQNLDKGTKAEAIWEKTATQGGEEALAAKFYMAELRVKARRFDEALKIYEKTLGDVEKPDDYRGALVPVARIAGTLEAACQEAEKAGALESACRLAKVYARVVRHEIGLLMIARMAEVKAKASNEAKDFKEAGLAYEGAAAVSSPGPQEARLLWSSAKNHLAAKDYSYAESVINHFIDLHPPADGLSEARYRLGEIAEAQQAQENATTPAPNPDGPGQEKPSKAEENWRKCYELPGAFAARAGVKLAVALQQRHKLEEAEAILQKNLDSTRVDEAQEESMFVLANIMYLQASYTRAKIAWERALLLYPTSRFTFLALYQLGDCYRRLADIDIETIRKNRGAFIDRNLQESAIQKHRYDLEGAEAKFSKLTEDIQAKRAGGAALTEFETDLLRRALFDLADCFVDHGKYEAARQTYERLAADYQEQIDGVEALKRLFYSYTVTNPPDRVKAADALSRQELVLKALPDSAFAGRLESESRRAYEKGLERQKGELEKLNGLYGDPKKNGLPEIIQHDG
jgi:TolA-binding protein